MPGESRALKTHFKMKAINSYRSSARVTEEIEDTRAIAQQLANATHGNPEESAVINQALLEACKDLPITYVIRIQIKVLFVWITVWRESCDISDGDTRAFIKKRANDLFNMLEAKI